MWILGKCVVRGGLCIGVAPSGSTAGLLVD
jgi:hypothetical protein